MYLHCTYFHATIFTEMNLFEWSFSESTYTSTSLCKLKTIVSLFLSLSYSILFRLHICFSSTSKPTRYTSRQKRKKKQLLRKCLQRSINVHGKQILHQARNVHYHYFIIDFLSINGESDFIRIHDRNCTYANKSKRIDAMLVHVMREQLTFINRKSEVPIRYEYRFSIMESDAYFTPLFNFEYVRLL